MPVVRTFEVMTERECRQILADHEVGRVAFVGDDGFPVILPVNYVIEQDLIAFRTARGEKFDSIPDQHVAFEVDGMERWSRSGWSVLVQGFGHDMTSAVSSQYDGLRSRTIDLWAPGDKPHWLAIEVRKISGRRIFSGAERTSSQFRRLR